MQTTGGGIIKIQKTNKTLSVGSRSEFTHIYMHLLEQLLRLGFEQRWYLEFPEFQCPNYRYYIPPYSILGPGQAVRTVIG